MAMHFEFLKVCFISWRFYRARRAPKIVKSENGRGRGGHGLNHGLFCSET
jgi:hypothetical protein